uniref:Uncharacterized protein n=1 Tax=Medicago truncatula TaxID=3880 RepID=A2Q1K5_MEDTR|nr:hypothetical protein MtrDRAFT_AC148918g39v2 [Medicago truncatula]
MMNNTIQHILIQVNTPQLEGQAAKSTIEMKHWEATKTKDIQNLPGILLSS